MSNKMNQQQSLPQEPAGITSKSVIKACVLVLASAALIYVGIRGFHRYRSNSSFIPATSRGRQAPNFALSTPDGKIVQLTAYRGKAVLLNFFGDTCEPCLEESPWLVEIQKQDKAKGLEIIGIEMYGASNDAIATYAKHFGTNYTLVHGNERSAL
jgi:thiol-disulfide isomerase/thioredoxin